MKMVLWAIQLTLTLDATSKVIQLVILPRSGHYCHFILLLPLNQVKHTPRVSVGNCLDCLDVPSLTAQVQNLC